MQKFSKKNRIYSVLKKQIRSQNGRFVRRWNLVRKRRSLGSKSRTTIRCLAVVISRMVVASYDGNTGNATLIHPGQAERPLHRCSLLCANGQSWKNRKSYRRIPVIFINPLSILHVRFRLISLFGEAV